MDLSTHENAPRISDLAENEFPSEISLVRAAEPPKSDHTRPYVAGRLTRALTGSRQRLREPPASLQRVSILPGNYAATIPAGQGKLLVQYFLIPVPVPICFWPTETKPYLKGEGHEI